MPTKRARFSQSLLGLGLLASCATAPPAAPSSAFALPPEEPPAAPAPVPGAGPSNNGDAWSVNGPDGLVALCQSLRDENPASFPGNAVEQARAEEAHAQRRQAALAGRYVAIVPAVGFAFRNYELGERRLILDTERGLALGDGAELIVPSKDPAPGFVLGPDLADRLLGQRTEGKLALRLIFRPAGSQLRKDACLWLGGGRVVKMEIEVLGAALIAPDGTVLSRGDTGEYADASPTAPVRSPKVTVRKPRAADGKDVQPSMAGALAVLAERAQPCYERVLIARPALRGVLVLGIRIGAGGRVETAHVEMSSLGDDTLVSCVTTNVAKATVAGTSSGQRFSVPLHFSSAEER
jgi:hypothetical protein